MEGHGAVSDGDWHAAPKGGGTCLGLARAAREEHQLALVLLQALHVDLGVRREGRVSAANTERQATGAVWGCRWL